MKHGVSPCSQRCGYAYRHREVTRGRWEQNFTQCQHYAVQPFLMFGGKGKDNKPPNDSLIFESDTETWTRPTVVSDVPVPALFRQIFGIYTPGKDVAPVESTQKHDVYSSETSRP